MSCVWTLDLWTEGHISLSFLITFIEYLNYFKWRWRCLLGRQWLSADGCYVVTFISIFICTLESIQVFFLSYWCWYLLWWLIWSLYWYSIKSTYFKFSLSESYFCIYIHKHNFDFINVFLLFFLTTPTCFRSLGAKILDWCHNVKPWRSHFLLIKKPSKMDVAPWCYKWVGGLDGNLLVGWGIEHLTVLITEEERTPNF